MRKLILKMIWISSDLFDWWMNFVKIFTPKSRIETGAKFDTYRRYSRYLNETNSGLILDGVNKALSVKDSMQNVCVMARVGFGKTSRYIIPNVVNRSNTDSSMIINDPKGEVFKATSGILEERGFQVIPISPDSPEFSLFFNALLEAKNHIEIEQVATIIVKAGEPAQINDPIWSKGATRFMCLFLRCLKNAERVEEGVNNLPNLYFLFQNFGSDGRKLDKWMMKHSTNPDDPDDMNLWNEWKGVLTGNKEGVASFVLNAITALRALSNPSMAQVTSRSDFSLEDLRKKKMALFFITPPQYTSYYRFFTSVFFRSAFNACMKRMPGENDRDIYFFIDEFGQMIIPDFDATATTIRAYKVSLSIVLQGISQLSKNYGHDDAKSILGGFATYLSYPGSDPETSGLFESIIGKKRITQISDPEKNQTEHYREENLMNASDIRMLRNEEAIIVSGNRQAIKIKTKEYYRQKKYTRLTQKGPITIERKPFVKLNYTQI